MDVNDLNYLYECTSCKIEKPNSSFHRMDRPSMKRKFAYICKECKKIVSKKYYEITRESNIAYSKEWSNKHKDRRKLHLQNYKERRPLKYIVNTAKGNSKRKGIPFEITELDIRYQLEKQKGLCYYTGDEMLTELGFQDSISIDRVNSLKGYSVDNIVLCKSKVNVIKNDASLGYLFDFCEKLLKNKENIINNYNERK